MSKQQLRHVQKGWARLVAQRDRSNNDSILTQIVHQAPCRWLPLPGKKNMYAHAVQSSYGGGLVAGDELHYEVHVRDDAQLLVTTQGAQRVYKNNSNTRPSRVLTTATVERNALLAFAPDPTSLFADSCYQQEQVLHLHSTSSIAWWDWVSGGRRVGVKDEFWQQKQFSSLLQVSIDSETPVLMDRTVLPFGKTGFQLGENTSFHTFATLLLYGDQAQPIVEQCRRLEVALVEPFTRVRQSGESSSTSTNIILDSLAGRVLVGVNDCNVDVPSSSPQSNQKLHVVRFAAEHTQDLYRIASLCWQPLFGGNVNGNHIVYPGRIQSQKSGSVAERQENDIGRNAETNLQISPSRLLPRLQALSHRALLLTDSALPTGGFAYSSGLEAASQLELVSTGDSLESFISSTVLSSWHQNAPLIVKSFRYWRQQQNDAVEWYRLQRWAHSHIVANELSCQASLDQGRNLLRLFTHNRNDDLRWNLLEQSSTVWPHHPLVWGAVAALLFLADTDDEETVVQLYLYTTARDLISSAVRLGLVGPMASVLLLDRVLLQAREQRGTPHLQPAGLQQSPASSSPILDAIQPVHSVLSTRLFRS